MPDRLGIRVNTLHPKCPVSQYRNHPFNSLCVGGNGDLIAAGDDGIYQLQCEEYDEGNTPVISHIKTHLLDFGTLDFKRLRFLYLGGESSGSMRVVANWGKGERTLAVPKLTREEDSRRVAVGDEKGKYWQFTISNPEGSDFGLDAVNVAPIYLES